MSFETLTRQSDAEGAQRAMVKFNCARRCFHIAICMTRAQISPG